jgi:hypothetical protein
MLPKLHGKCIVRSALVKFLVCFDIISAEMFDRKYITNTFLKQFNFWNIFENTSKCSLDAINFFEMFPKTKFFLSLTLVSEIILFIADSLWIWHKLHSPLIFILKYSKSEISKSTKNVLKAFYNCDWFQIAIKKLWIIPSNFSGLISDSARHWSHDICPPISQIVLMNFIKTSLIITECPDFFFYKIGNCPDDIKV